MILDRYHTEMTFSSHELQKHECLNYVYKNIYIHNLANHICKVYLLHELLKHGNHGFPNIKVF